MPGRNFLSIEGRENLARLARDLRDVGDGRELDRQVRQELGEIGRDQAGNVRAAIRRIPSKGQNAARGRRSLRSEMAAAVESKVRTTRRPGLIVRVNPGRMPPNKRTTPAYMDGQPPFHRWRHKTFGVWRSKTPTQRAHPYFDRATAGTADQAQRAGDQVIDRMADRIERGR